MTAYAASPSVSTRVLLVIVFAFLRLVKAGVLRLKVDVLHFLRRFSSSIQTQIRNLQSILLNKKLADNEQGCPQTRDVQESLQACRWFQAYRYQSRKHSAVRHPEYSRDKLSCASQR